MAHFAMIDENNIVRNVVVVSDTDIQDGFGRESELIGENFCKVRINSNYNWKKCSYNTYGGKYFDRHKTKEENEATAPLRANYPSPGYIYDPVNDIFHQPKPENCDSWSLNTTTGFWDPPITLPELSIEERVVGNYYRWDEDAYQADNTTGWVLVTPE